MHFFYSSDKPWESNSTFPMLGCLNTIISVLKGHCGVIVKLQICVVGLFQTTGLIFHPLLASIDFWSQTEMWLDHYCHKKCQRSVEIWAPWSGKSPLTHFISSVMNTQAWPKTERPHEAWGGSGVGVGVGDETAAKHTFLNATRPAICVKSRFFLLNMVTRLPGAAGHQC